MLRTYKYFYLYNVKNYKQIFKTKFLVKKNCSDSIILNICNEIAELRN